ncbi:hypothetical protein BJ508DRAFT_320062 [Ascobolus immersus RN42]|uniref:Uncharacterized protein n=1 Tax=Ascobolus immersus RN42 TaxID=1160509 RepID=A0A3N4IR91_ASCIM|nr:hypothetical protein BJ508DRAFT_320062 [Ascobolus immersus RN42]
MDLLRSQLLPTAASVAIFLSYALPKNSDGAPNTCSDASQDAAWVRMLFMALPYLLHILTVLVLPSPPLPITQEELRLLEMMKTFDREQRPVGNQLTQSNDPDADPEPAPAQPSTSPAESFMYLRHTLLSLRPRPFVPLRKISPSMPVFGPVDAVICGALYISTFLVTFLPARQVLKELPEDFKKNSPYSQPVVACYLLFNSAVIVGAVMIWRYGKLEVTVGEPGVQEELR